AAVFVIGGNIESSENINGRFQTIENRTTFFAKMACLLAGRYIAQCCGRQSACIYSSRRQQTYAACARTQTATVESYCGSKPPVIPIFRQVPQFTDRVALRDRHGDYTYRGLFLSSRQFAGEITNSLEGKRQERVAFLCPNDASYLIVQWACWMSGQIVVPMAQDHPTPIHDLYIKHSEAGLVVTTSEYAHSLQNLANKNGAKLLVIDDALRVLAMRPSAKSTLLPPQPAPSPWNEDEQLEAGLEPQFYNESDAMIIYTSGTTGTPKGVVVTHSNIQAQISSLVKAWGWNEKDVVLHTLPLHHIHGIVNVLMCPLVVGGRCVMLPKFEPSRVWSQLLAINMPASERINVFMAVPTIYMKLVEEYEHIFTKNQRMQEYIRSVCSQKIRLMVSGSSPLPTPLFEKWEKITGHKLLERYGMTETGMVLSNPLHGERKPGFVGTPLPGVEVQIAKNLLNQDHEVLVQGSETQGTTTLSTKYTSGELRVKGPNIFKGYWKDPKATKKEFTSDGWFKT
ncbi:hypothetical protein L9F63_024040, partial [Diploptera punctata]